MKDQLRIISKFKYRIFIALFLMAAVMVGTQLTLFFQQKSEETFTSAINDSGRQRMLTLNLVLESKMLIEEKALPSLADNRRRLLELSERLFKNHESLEEKANQLRPELADIYSDVRGNLDSGVHDFISSVETLTQTPIRALTTDNPDYRHVQESFGALIAAFDEETNTWQSAAEKNIEKRTQSGFISLLIFLILLAALIFLVFRPLLQILEKEIKSYADLNKTLEYRVANRTKSLESRTEELLVYQTALHESEKRFRDFATASSDWFWEMDENLQFSYLSGQFTEITGETQDQVLGKTNRELGIFENVQPEDWERYLATLDAHEPFKNLIFSRTRPDGEVLWLSASGNPVFDAHGAFKGYRGASSDITVLKKTEGQLFQSAKMATLGEMASGIAHEINQPLSIIRMASENCLHQIREDSFTPESMMKKLETVEAQTERMAEITNHMRVFARVDRGDDAPFEVSDSIVSAVHLTQHQLKQSRIELDQQIPENCRLVSGSSIQLEQVLINLINNSKDAIEERGKREAEADRQFKGEIDIVVTDNTRKHSLIISISDNGGGIPEEAEKRIFDPFFTTKEVGKGTGLGLSISYSIIQSMGGQIDVKNIPDGTQFDIKLPALARNKCKPNIVDLAVKDNARRIPPSERPLEILVVDDELFAAQGLAEYLNYKGHVVETAGDGFEALELYKKGSFDVMITDLRMPKMDGNQLMDHLREINPDLPVFIVTGHTSIGEDQEIIDKGATHLIKKPFSLQDVEEKLERLVI